MTTAEPDIEDEATRQGREDREMITTIVHFASQGEGDEGAGELLGLFADPAALLDIIGAMCREMVRNGVVVNELREAEAFAEVVHKQFGALAGGILGMGRRADRDDQDPDDPDDPDAVVINRLADALWDQGGALRALIAPGDDGLPAATTRLGGLADRIYALTQQIGGLVERLEAQRAAKEGAR